MEFQHGDIKKKCEEKLKDFAIKCDVGPSKDKKVNSTIVLASYLKTDTVIESGLLSSYPSRSSVPPSLPPFAYRLSPSDHTFGAPSVFFISQQYIKMKINIKI